MEIQNNIAAVLANNSLIPVVTFNKLEEVPHVLETLINQNINCIEITLRTDVAIEAIQHVQEIAPSHFSVGVGTIVNAQQVAACKQLDVDFMVSPGSSSSIIKSMQDSGIAYLPGVMTPSEIVKAMENNCYYLKLFPFNIAGGLSAVKSYGKVFPKVRFCPTGGVNASNYQELLNLDAVVAVGGSWLV